MTHNKKIRKARFFSINIAFLFAIIFLIVLSVFSYKRVQSFDDDAMLVYHSNQVRYQLENIFSNFKDMESGSRGYLLTNDSAFLKHFEKADDNIILHLRHLDSLKREYPSRQENLLVLKNLSYKKIDYIKNLIADTMISSQELLSGKAIMNDIRVLIDKMEKNEEELLKTRIIDFKRESFLTPIVTTSLSIIAIIILVIAYYKNFQQLKISNSLELSLEERNIALEQMNKELETFTFISSHDLQEPLRKIKNFISILLAEEQEKLSDDGKHYLQRTSYTAQQMQQLIEDLLTYAHAKNVELKFESVHLNKIIEDVKKSFEEAIKEKKGIIEAGNLCEAKLSYSQFRQLIQNLISNSLKFSKNNIPPHIVIKSEIVAGNTFNNEKLSSKIDYCHIIYTDNGIGFEPEYNERIFEIFQRLHGKDEYKGSGMGLAICKRIAENHKGIITASGKLNEGARFDIYIPVE